ncbi:tetratricopeptide repeat protein [Streptomyces niveus]|uniref:tetratricopeptide repeat protein n=1 Tax=Streptomyces niveus TaxID=193462 RepID=UPI003694459F
MTDAGQSPEVTAEARELHERGVEALREGRALDAEDLFREAYEAGHAGAANDLGNSLAAWRDLDGAREWWRRAADAGITEAAFNLALDAEEKGDDPEEAERWYRRAATDEHRDALLNLGKLLEGQDEDESMSLYLRASELGSDKAAFNIGLLYDNRGELTAAEPWYSRAAERGNPSGAFNLGHVRLDLGNVDGALEAWRHAADLQHRNAAHSVGIILARGGDEDGAAEWFRRAAREFADPRGAKRLATYYEARGDAAEAARWTSLAERLSAPPVEVVGMSWRPEA